MCLKPFQPSGPLCITVLFSQADRDAETWHEKLMGIEIETGRKADLFKPGSLPFLMFTVWVPWHFEALYIMSDGERWGQVAFDCLKVGSRSKGYPDLYLSPVRPGRNLSLADGLLLSTLVGKYAEFLDDPNKYDREWFKTLPHHMGAKRF